MTTEEKNKALKLKDSGLSVREIAKEVNVSHPAIIKLFKKLEDESIKRLSYCANCGKEMIFNIRPVGRPARFCCKECRLEYHAKHREKKKAFICKCCGKEFADFSYRKALFCSRRCAHRYRYGEKRI